MMAIAQKISWSKILIYTSLGLFLLSFGCSLWLGYQYQQTKQEREEQAFTYAQKEADRVQRISNRQLNAQERIASKLSTEITKRDLPYNEIVPSIQNAVQESVGLFGIVVAFEPNTYPGTSRLYAPYYRKKESGEYALVEINQSYDYADSENPAANWYIQTVDAGESQWHSLFGEASREFIILYTAPFYTDDSQDQIAGVVGVARSAETFENEIQSLNLGEEGYISLVNEEGIIVSHPKPEFINATKEEVAKSLNEPQLLSDLNKAIQGGDFYRLRTSAAEENAWTFYKPLAAPGWTVVTMIFTDVLALEPKVEMHMKANIGIAVLASVIFLIILILRIDRGDKKNLWAFSLITALAFLGGITWLWHLVIYYPQHSNRQDHLINNAAVEDVLAPVDEYSTERHQPLLTRIPTGILVEKLNISAHSATVSGYVWQKFPTSLPDSDISAPHFSGIVGRPWIEERYRFEKDDMITVGWFFSLNLEQAFDVRRYPLDEITVNISIEPSSLDKNLVLVPDLFAYEFITSTKLPGVNQTIHVPGWLLQESYFSYTTEDYNVSFGDANILQKDIRPSLSFNIRANRELLSPLISYGVIVFLISVQLFGLIVLNIEKESQILSIAAALFFIVTMTHTSLRKSLAFSTTTYFEYSFIVLYIAIVLGAVNEILARSDLKIPLISYRDNLLVKIAVWPVFLGVIWIISMIFLYPWQ